ncbi:hypothetical protein CRYPD_1327 [uncultured Candidatus Thioglobus sp.]|nr:hypothetical protein CRYPD_1327 [uncultured Candidatus Thioglobus sp.]
MWASFLTITFQSMILLIMSSWYVDETIGKGLFLGVYNAHYINN